MTWLGVTVCALAVWRVTHIVLYENGPWRAARRLREMFGVQYEDDDSDRVVSYKYELFVCRWCLSVWIGGLVAILYITWPVWSMYALLPFALSALALIASMLLEKDKRSADRRGPGLDTTVSVQR